MIKLILLVVGVTLISATEEWEDARQNVEPLTKFTEGAVNQQMNSIFIYKIIQVTNASRLAANQWDYKMSFIMSPTNCTKLHRGANLRCTPIWSKTKLSCSAEVSVSPTNVPSLTQSYCHTIRRSVVSRRRRSVLVGGISPPVSDPELYRDIIDRATSMVNPDYAVKKIRSVRTQVVSGVRYFVQMEVQSHDLTRRVCETTVWTRPWLKERFNGFLVTRYTCDGEDLLHRQYKRGALGGISDVRDLTPLREKVMRALRMSNANLKNVQVIGARQQVVSGINYYLTVRGDNSKGQETVCQLRIYEQTWTNTFTVKSFTCNRDI